MSSTTGPIPVPFYEVATLRQVEYLRAIDEHGSIRAAARALKVNYTTINQALQHCRSKAEQAKTRAVFQGHSPEHGLTAPGLPAEFPADGISLYIDKDRKPGGYWLKGKRDREKYETMVRETIRALTADLRGLAPLTPAPRARDEDLLSVYPLGDPHFGMYAWAKETGDNFDLDIARELTLGAVDRLVSVGPPSGTAILLPLGDVFHMDDQTNRTPQSQHQLDADGRYGKVIQVGIQTFKHAAQRLLQKHSRVVIRFLKGNHDPNAVWALRFSIAEFFANEPRVTVELSPAAHWFYRFDKVLIGATHGDETKHRDLLGVMAVDRSQDWGETKHRYFYTGHVHNQVVTELPGLLCESFRTLAARDAYSTGAGYRAGRDMRLIVHHREDGEIERYRCDASRIIKPENSDA